MNTYNFSILLTELQDNFQSYLRPFHSKELNPFVKTVLSMNKIYVEDVKSEYVDPTGKDDKSYIKFTVTSQSTYDLDKFKKCLKK